jgi:7-keto-8-aminopelargonate synthetase-like enzyme
MPYGRSGGFIISTTNLAELLKAVSATTAVGMIFNSSPSPVNAVDVVRFLRDHSHDRVAVEEQDHAAYIIHIGEVASWVFVRSDSPVFAELLQRARSVDG